MDEWIIYAINFSVCKVLGAEIVLSASPAAKELNNLANSGKIVQSMPKRTFQPKKRKRSRVHGFIKRMSTRQGRRVLKTRRQKGRAQLSR